MDPRWVPKRPKIVPRRLQDGLMPFLCSNRFLHCFFVAFWIDFGAILAPFRELKSVILGIDFWMIFACRSKSAQERPKSAQERPKSAPRTPQERPRSLQGRKIRPLGRKT